MIVDSLFRWLRANAINLVVVGVALYGLASPLAPTWASRYGVIAAGLLVAYGAFALSGAGGRVPRRSLAAMAATIAIFGVAAVVPQVGFATRDLPAAPLRALIAIGILAAVAAPSSRSRHFQIAVGGIAIVMASWSGFVHVANTPDLATDVIYGHREAAAALAVGDNPYADISFRDTAPEYANVGMIEGYAYPPVALVPYVLAEWLGDARWVGVVALAATMGIVLFFGSRQPRLGLLLVGIGLTYPMIGAIVAHGYTESISLLLVVLAAVTIRRVRLGGAVSGLALASKQYMVITGFALMAMRRPGRWLQLGIAVGVAVMTIVPFFLWDPGALWDSQVGFQLDRVQRFDTLSVAWLIRIPIPIALCVSAGVGLLLGARSRSRGSLLLAQAASLATYFTLSPNSFRNYFFIVAMMVIGAIALDDPLPSHGPGTHPPRSEHSLPHADSS